VAIGDVNSILRTYLVAQDSLTAIVGTRIYCPRLPENCSLPAIGYFVRGGVSTPYIPPIITSSFQFDCWGSDPIEARNVYRKLYDILQGIQNIDVVIGDTTYKILSAREEVQGQDLVDETIPNYFRTLAFFSITVRAE